MKGDGRNGKIFETNVEQRKDALKFFYQESKGLILQKTGLTILDWTRRKVYNWYGTIYGNQTHMESI